MGTHPPGPLDMFLRPILNGPAVQAKTTTNRLWVPGTLVAGGQLSAASRGGVPLHSPAQPKHCIPMLLDPRAHHRITASPRSNSSAITATCSGRRQFAVVDFPRRRPAAPAATPGSGNAAVLTTRFCRRSLTNPTQVRITRLGRADLYALTAITITEVDRIAAVAGLFVPDQFDSTDTLLLDGTLIPVHEQSLCTPRKNYRRSVNMQVMATLNRRIVHAG